MEIGQVIREARAKAKLSQRALATRLGVAPSAVGQWETDVTKPSLDNRVDLASVLKIPFVELLPEVAGIPELSTSDLQTIALVRQFEKLPPAIREAILMQVSSTLDSLSAGLKPPHEKE